MPWRIALRRDQRAFRSAFTGCRSALSPSRPRPFRYAASALVTSGDLALASINGGLPSPARRRDIPLRLRFAIRSSPRLRSTFPARRPQTEADSLIFSPPDDGPRLGVLEPPAPDLFPGPIPIPAAAP